MKQQGVKIGVILKSSESGADYYVDWGPPVGCRWEIHAFLRRATKAEIEAAAIQSLAQIGTG